MRSPSGWPIKDEGAEPVRLPIDHAMKFTRGWVHDIYPDPAQVPDDVTCLRCDFSPSAHLPHNLCPRPAPVTPSRKSLLEEIRSWRWPLHCTFERGVERGWRLIVWWGPEWNGWGDE